MNDEESDNPRIADPAPIDVDLTDETQDFRFLAQLTKKDASIPKRGEKDFEPDGTDLQASTLHESRQAMYTALSLPPAGTPLVRGIWHPEVAMAEIDVPRGPHFKSMGRADSKGVTWLLPEETIYLVERGNLDCYWESGVPMDLAGVYAACMDACGGLERYIVYAYLRRNGYAVLRASTFWGRVDEEEFHMPWLWRTGMFWERLRKVFTCEKRIPTEGPLVGKGVYRGYDEVYRRLELVPRYSSPDRRVTPPTCRNAEMPWLVTFNVWKPRPNFKKSAPGEPDFRMSVIDARDTNVPTLSQIAGLFSSAPFDPIPEKEKPQFQRLKDGHRNVILAVVDSGITSFLKLSDVEFGNEKMYLRKPASPKGKGGRGGKGKSGGGEKTAQVAAPAAK